MVKVDQLTFTRGSLGVVVLMSMLLGVFYKPLPDGILEPWATR